MQVEFLFMKLKFDCALSLRKYLKHSNIDSDMMLLTYAKLGRNICSIRKN